MGLSTHSSDFLRPFRHIHSFLWFEYQRKYVCVSETLFKLVVSLCCLMRLLEKVSGSGEIPIGDRWGIEKSPRIHLEGDGIRFLVNYE